MGISLGADLSDSDTVFSSTPHSVDTPLQIYVAGIPAAVEYKGSAGYPGVNQINFTIPTGLTPGVQPVVVTVGTASSPSAKIASGNPSGCVAPNCTT